MEYRFIKEGGFDYIEEGKGPVLLLLHGLFGALSNWYDVLKTFSKEYTVIIPLMPVYIPTKVEADVQGLADFVHEFVKFKKLKDLHLVGNSLGGHVALTFYQKYSGLVKTMTLTGSSGLFEAGMGSTFPRRGDIKYIRDRVEYTFYSPETATEELVQEVVSIVNDSQKAIRVIKIARNAQRSTVLHFLKDISIPVCLVWGMNDNITPTYVAYEFYRNIPNAELHFIDRCGHAAMMERPQRFNLILEQFLSKHT